jgi:hypothetical protein
MGGVEKMLQGQKQIFGNIRRAYLLKLTGQEAVTQDIGTCVLPFGVYFVQIPNAWKNRGMPS